MVRLFREHWEADDHELRQGLRETPLEVLRRFPSSQRSSRSKHAHARESRLTISAREVQEDSCRSWCALRENR